MATATINAPVKDERLAFILKNPYGDIAHDYIRELDQEEKLSEIEVAQIISKLKPVSNGAQIPTVEVLIELGALNSTHAHKLLVASNRHPSFNGIDRQLATVLFTAGLMDDKCINYALRKTDFSLLDDPTLDFLIALSEANKLTAENMEIIFSGGDAKTQLSETKVEDIFTELLSVDPDSEVISVMVNYPFKHSRRFKSLLENILSEGLLSREHGIEALARLINLDKVGFITTYRNNPEDYDYLLIGDTPLTKKEQEYLVSKTGLIVCGVVGSGGGMIAYVPERNDLRVYAGCEFWEGNPNQHTSPILAIAKNIRHPNIPFQWDHAEGQELTDWRKSVRAALKRIEALVPLANKNPVLTHAGLLR